MKKKNIEEEYEQLRIDFGNELSVVDKDKRIEVGAKVEIKPEAQRFCDGRGVPDCARTAYVKRINLESNTILIETEPNGKELGLLFIHEVIAV